MAKRVTRKPKAKPDESAEPKPAESEPTKPATPEPVQVCQVEEPLRKFLTPIASIAQDPRNPRQHSDRNVDAIARSLATFGQQKPIVINADNQAVAGNGTLVAAVKLGWTHIAAIQTTLAGSQAAAYSIADNRVGDPDIGSVWNQDELAELLAELQNDESIDELVTGFDQKAIAKLVDERTGFGQDESDQIESRFSVVVDCDSEQAQLELIEWFTAEGLECRAITL